MATCLHLERVTQTCRNDAQCNDDMQNEENTRASLTGSSSSSSAISCVQQCDQAAGCIAYEGASTQRTDKQGSGAIAQIPRARLWNGGGARNGLVRAGSMTVEDQNCSK